MPHSKDVLSQKFWERVEKQGSHWVWTGGLTAGRAAFCASGKLRYGHRLAWEINRGPIPESFIVQRQCEEPMCVNPDHFRCIPRKHVGTLPRAVKKRCRACGVTKQAAEFPRKEQKSDGLESYCTECQKERQRSWNLKKYGITTGDFDAMLAAQDGKCAACGGPPTGKGNRLRVDHDHTTGAVRELLCNGCNLALGHVKDEPARLVGLIKYLERHQ